MASEVAKEGAESKEDSSREVEELQARVKTLTEEKQSLEIQLDGHRQAAKEERERGEIIAAEKKARAQVRSEVRGERRSEPQMFVSSFFKDISYYSTNSAACTCTCTCINPG